MPGICLTGSLLGFIGESLAYMYMTADPGLQGQISPQPHNFLEDLYHYSTPSIDSRRAVVSFCQKYVHKLLLVNQLED